MSFKPKVLFIHEIPVIIDDGLRMALKLLRSSYDITWWHIDDPRPPGEYQCALAQGSFYSIAFQKVLQEKGKRLLLIAGTADPVQEDKFECIFYETEWYKPKLKHKNLFHALGVNTQIFKPISSVKIWEYVTVGAFSNWKRQHLLTNFQGNRLAVGQIQEQNLVESMNIVSHLLSDNVMISGMVSSDSLAKIYNASKCVYIPASIDGGGERAVLEARACGIKVLVEVDNPKLQELLVCPIFDHNYFASQLKKGIESVL